MEAAIAFGYTLAEWQQETPENRARAIAHVVHKSLREGYANEKAMEKGDKGDKPAPNSYESMMRHWMH